MYGNAFTPYIYFLDHCIHYITMPLLVCSASLSKKSLKSLGRAIFSFLTISQPRTTPCFFAQRWFKFFPLLSFLKIQSHHGDGRDGKVSPSPPGSLTRFRFSGRSLAPPVPTIRIVREEMPGRPSWSFPSRPSSFQPTANGIYFKFSSPHSRYQCYIVCLCFQMSYLWLVASTTDACVDRFLFLHWRASVTASKA